MSDPDLQLLEITPCPFRPLTLSSWKTFLSPDKLFVDQDAINKPNYVRLNAWPGFLNRSITELACSDQSTKKNAVEIFNQLGWNFVWVKDDYGLIAARIIAMIINEAYYALEENVSTKKQIDIAMKLGTNYPFGPFEWSEKIGLNNILQLLNHLQKQGDRYAISSLLIKESSSI